MFLCIFYAILLYLPHYLGNRQTISIQTNTFCPITPDFCLCKAIASYQEPLRLKRKFLEYLPVSYLNIQKAVCFHKRLHLFYYLLAFSISYRGSFFYFPCTFKTTYKLSIRLLPIPLRSCPRPISSSQLHTLLHFHLCPIYLVVFKGSYYFRRDISS